MDITEKYKLRKFIRNLALIRGRHTELVSVYIPQNYNIQKIIQHLEQEKHTASNIKDSKTRKHVIEALEKIIHHLKLFKKTPQNGLAVFSGNISQKQSQTNIEVFSIEPPTPLKIRTYRCDQKFLLDPLEEMLEDQNTYGLIVVDRREASIGILKGTLIKEINKATSGVPGKTKAGGQSAKRFESLREIAAKEFYKRIAEIVNKEFQEKELKGILIGGPGHTKNEFIDTDYLNKELKQKIITIQDLSYTGPFGLNELVEKSKQTIAQEEIIQEKELVHKFLEKLAKEPEKTAYKIQQIKKALQLGAVDTLLISETIEPEIAQALSQEAKDTAANIKIISTETTEGIQLKNLGGLAAILRFRIN